MDDWDKFEAWLGETEQAVADVDALAMAAGADTSKLAPLLAKAGRLRDALDGVCAHIEDKLAEAVPPSFSPTSYMSADGAWVITVSWGERREWDEEQLKLLVGKFPGNDPDFIRRKIGVDKRAWDRASDDDRKEFLAALTVKLGKRKVEVKRN